MTKVSKRILNKDLEDRIFTLFVKTIVELRDSLDVQNFLEDILSPSEKVMLVKRLAIATLLAKGYTYDTIDETLKVSRPTIMNVSYWFKYGRGGYVKVVEKILKDEKREAFGDSIEELLLNLSPPKAYGSIGFQKKQKRGKELVQRKRTRSLI